MSDRKPSAGPEFALPWLNLNQNQGAPQALEDAGRRAFTAFNQAAALATEMGQAVLARQQRIVDGEFRRFVERMQGMNGAPPGPDMLEKEASAIRDSIETTTREMQALSEILLNGNRKMLELWLNCFNGKADGK